MKKLLAPRTINVTYEGNNELLADEPEEIIKQVDRAGIIYLYPGWIVDPASRMAYEVAKLMQKKVKIIRDDGSTRRMIYRLVEIMKVDMTTLRGKSRKRNLVEQRMFFAYLLWRYTGMSYSGVGKILMRDHATIMAYIRNVESLAKYNKAFAKRLQAIEVFFLKNIML
ncbi:MAG: Bacterial dnaA protein helix-turn-helix [Bacteroidales bacterium]|nr:Bacterial dnaA protein helix-turn-helix [Bacteroidales bacterium]MDN5329366.1 Bacterial dnaA protein helix-turn-helix [Bacteroidales bacterium]